MTTPNLQFYLNARECLLFKNQDYNNYEKENSETKLIVSAKLVALALKTFLLLGILTQITRLFRERSAKTTTERGIKNREAE